METLNQVTPLYWISGALVVFSVLLIFIVFLVRATAIRIRQEEQEKAAVEKQHQLELLKNSIEIQEKERVRIAADIHDGLIATLYQLQLSNEDKQLHKKLTESITIARSISHDLSPPLLEEIKLNELFNHFLQSFQSSYRIEFYYAMNITESLSTFQKLNLYRIFQELIINIKKHAKSDVIKIHLRANKSRLMLSVKDNGIGFENAASGLGMKNIKLRAQQLNAQFKFKENQYNGTCFLLTFKW